MSMGTNSGMARIEDLLSEDDWLRGLVLGMVHSDEVEDVLQQTRLAALEHRPRKAVRAWLAKVAHNFALRHKRDEGRRRRHEHAAARPEALPSTEETVQRMNAQRQVTSAVSALEEPYRTAVILRWYHGQSHAEIAVRMQCSPDNARQRCSRGLAMLRSEVNTTLGQDWRQNRGLLLLTLPRGEITQVPCTPNSLPLMMTGALTVKKTIASATVALVILATGTLLYVESDTGKGAPTAPAPIAFEPVQVATPRAITATGEPSRQQANLPTPDAALPGNTGWRISGQVLDLQGHPVPNVTVTSTTAPLPQFNSKGMASEIGQSDSSGYFEIELPIRPGDKLGVAGPWVLLYGQPADTELRQQEGLLLVVAPSIDVGGRVFDMNNSPLTDVTISIDNNRPSDFPMPLDMLISYQSRRSVQSDDEGNFDTGPLPGGGCSLAFTKPGYKRVSIEVPTEGLDDQVIRMTAGNPGEIILRGIVLGWRNELIEGARVGFGQSQTTTDRYGNFELVIPTHSIDTDLSLVAGKAGWQSAVLEGFGDKAEEAARRDELIELRLAGPSLSISGRIVDADGRPMRGMPIFPWQERMAFSEMTPEDLAIDPDSKPFDVAGNPIRAFARSARDGSFTILGLRDKSYRMRLYDPEIPFVFTSDAIAAGSSDIEIVIPADAIRDRVSGMLRTRDGSPIADATISYLIAGIDNGPTIVRQGRPVGKTDKDGRFSLEDIPRYGGALSFSGDEIESLEVELDPLDPGDNLELTALRIGHFKVEVVTDTDRASGCTVIDADGKHLPLTLRTLKSSSSSVWMKLQDGKSPIYMVSEQAVTLIIYQADRQELARLPMRIVPGQVLHLRY